MPTASTPLVSVHNVDVVRISEGQETPLARAATVTLSIVASASASNSPSTTPKRRTPPPPPGSAGPAGAAATSTGSVPPPPPPYSTATTPRTASTTVSKLQEHIQLSVVSPKDGLNLLEIPLPSGKQTTSSIVTLPPATYIIPDPVRNGFIKLILPTGAAGAVDAETRELFEAALFTNLDSPTGIASSDGITELQAQRNQLYIVDEDTGRLIGQLDSGNGAHLQEAEALAAGQVQDGKTQTGAFDGKMTGLDDHEAVVIDTVVTTGEGSDGTGTITYTVQPASAYYRPVDNPTNSRILSTANTVSRGLVIGSELLARQLQRGTGHYVSSRPATQTPMQFSETTKGAFHKSSEWTRTATVYSGKAVGAIGNAAARLGDRIGRKTGVQGTRSSVTLHNHGKYADQARLLQRARTANHLRGGRARSRRL